MYRKNIIVFIRGERIETYGNLKKCCEMEGLKYHTLARLKFPIRINDVEYKRSKNYGYETIKKEIDKERNASKETR